MSEQIILVDDQLVKHIAGLAKISITEQENAIMTQSITAMLDLINQIKDVPSIESSQYEESVNIEDLADDVENNINHTKHLTTFFPHFKNGYFTVPAFVSQN